MFIIASGLNLIFGVLRVINFAHGMFYMFGAYIVFTVAKTWGAPFFVGVLAAGGGPRDHRAGDRTAAAPAPVRQGAPDAAPVHLRAGAADERCREDDLGNRPVLGRLSAGSRRAR